MSTSYFWRSASAFARMSSWRVTTALSPPLSSSNDFRPQRQAGGRVRVDGTAADNRGGNTAPELPAVERRVLRLRSQRAGDDGDLQIGGQHGDVRGRTC